MKNKLIFSVNSRINHIRCKVHLRIANVESLHDVYHKTLFDFRINTTINDDISKLIKAFYRK